MTTPRGSPELAEGQAVPETAVNEQIRRTEAGACHYPVTDRVTAPPGSCSDGANYLIIATATGAFTGKENQIATAVGANASNGWYYHTPIEGFTAYVQDENARYLYGGASWAIDTTGGGGGTAATLDFDTDGTLAANSDAKIATQKATKTYVDAKVAGLSWKQAVRVATTANGTLASAFENGDTVDGVTLATGDRILIKNQSSGAENGIYTVNASGAPTRATDADSGAELVNASVYVSEGTTNADTQWTCTTNATITLGSTSLAFAQLTSGGVPAGAITSSGLTMATARLLGRTTASTGAIEEISVGSGLTLSAGSLSASGSGYSGGVQSLGILATALKMRATNGPSPGASESSTNKVNYETLDFDASTAEYAQILFPMPKSWNESTVTVQFLWTSAAGSGNVVWAAQGVAISDDDPLDAAFGTAQSVTDGVTAAGDLMISSFSSAITIGGSPAEGDLVCLQVYRDAANGSDTMSGDAKLIGIRLNFTTNAADDS